MSMWHDNLAWGAIFHSLRRCTGGTILGLNSHFQSCAYELKFSPLCRDASSLLDPMECTDTAEEQRVHSPPASLVPRIHVVLAQKLQHINPLLPACLNKEESKTCKCKCWGLGTQRPLALRMLGAACAVCLRWGWAGQFLVAQVNLAISVTLAHFPLCQFSLLKWGPKVDKLSYFECWHHLTTNILSLH